MCIRDRGEFGSGGGWPALTDAVCGVSGAGIWWPAEAAQPDGCQGCLCGGFGPHNCMLFVLGETYVAEQE
eukprot:2841492-Prymnesium_polylepis.1